MLFLLSHVVMCPKHSKVEVCLLIENFDYCFRIFDSIPFHIDFIRISYFFPSRPRHSKTTDEEENKTRKNVDCFAEF